MNVQTETGSMACHYTAGFYYGAPAGGQSSSPSDSPSAPLSPPTLTCAKTAAFLTMHHVVVMIRRVRVCVRAAVRECAHTSLPIPHPRLYPTPHTIFFFFFCPPKTSLAAACNKNMVHPENQPARLSLASPSSLSF